MTTNFNVIKKGINILSSVVMYSYKILYIGEAIADSCYSYNNTNLGVFKKTMRIATNVLFGTTQVTELYNSNASPEILLKLRGASAMTHIVNETNKELICTNEPVSRNAFFHITNVIVMRLADMLGIASKQYPSYESLFKDSSHACLGVSTLIEGREKIYMAASKGVERFRTRNKIPEQLQPATIPKELLEDADYSHEVQSDFQLVKEVLRNDSFEDLTDIPNLFLSDRILKQWVCPIKKKPIRYVLVVKGTEDYDEPIFYEKACIEDWFETRPSFWSRLFSGSQKKPAGWPEGISLKQSNLSPSNSAQNRINNALKYLFEDLKNEFKD